MLAMRPYAIFGIFRHAALYEIFTFPAEELTMRQQTGRVSVAGSTREMTADGDRRTADGLQSRQQGNS